MLNHRDHHVVDADHGDHGYHGDRDYCDHDVDGDYSDHMNMVMLQLRDCAQMLQNLNILENIVHYICCIIFV